MDFESWKAELLLTGNIVQDDDDSVSEAERVRRSERYLEMVNAIEGTDGEDTYCALVESMRAENDYGAYQSTFNALGRFPPDVAGGGLVRSLPGLIRQRPHWAGDLLCGLPDEHVAGLNAALAQSAQEVRDLIVAFVLQEEDGGWLEDRTGEIRPQ